MLNPGAVFCADTFNISVEYKAESIVSFPSPTWREEIGEVILIPTPVLSSNIKLLVTNVFESSHLVI